MKQQESGEKDLNRSFGEVIDEQKPFLKQEKKPLTSDHTDYYLQAMERINTPSKKQLIKKNLQGKFSEGIYGVITKIKRIIESSNNSYLFDLGFGGLFRHVSFLKTRANLNFIYNSQIDAGAYGKIYFLQFQTKKYVVKSQQLRNSQELFLQEKFENLLKEYFCAKLASCLRIGPKVESLFGYDILIHNNCFEFVMEYCGGGIIDTGRMKKDLMENLKIMHSLGIVHMDIKPENIGWSNEFKKWVFLDFGFARFLDAKIGQKSETGFIGTFNYTSKEMKQLYHLRKKGFVDLYYNDLFSLEESLKNIQAHRTTVKNQPSFYGKEKNNTTIFFNSVLSLLKTKFDLFRNKYEQIPEYLPKIDLYRQCLLGVFLGQMNQKSDHEKKVIWSLYISEKKKNQKINPQKNSETPYLKEIKQIFEEQQPQLIQWEPFSLFLEQQDQIRRLLKQSWGKKKFMKKTFDFFHKTLFHKNQFLNKKNKSLRKLISEQIFPGSKEKSSFWKLRNILSKFEEFFIKEYNASREYNFSVMDRINSIHRMIGDLTKGLFVTKQQTHASNLFTLFSELFCYFFQNNTKKANKQKCILCLKKISQIPFEEYKVIDKNQKLAIISVMNKIFQASQAKNISEADFLEIQNIMEKYQSFSFQSKKLYDCIFFYVRQWIQHYQVFNHSVMKNYLHQKKYSLQISNFFQITQEIKKHMTYGRLVQMVKAIEKNPFILQIPSLFNIQYYKMKKEKSKMKEMINDFLDLIKPAVQIYAEYYYLLTRNSQEQKFQVICLILDFFLEFSVPNLTTKRLHFYQLFLHNVYNEIERIPVTKKQEQVLNSKICLILKAMIRYLQKQEPQFETLLSIKHNIVQLKKFKGEKFLQEFIILFEGTIEQIKGWTTYQKKFLLRNLCQFFYLSEGDHKLVLKRLIFQHNDSLTQGERNQLYVSSDISFLTTLLEVYGTDSQSLKQFYQIIKNHTDYISASHLKNIVLEYVFFKFTEYHKCQMLAILIKSIFLNLSLGKVRDNFYLSAFFYMIYRKVKLRLSANEKKRILIFSMVKIDSFPFFKTRSCIKRSLVFQYTVVKQLNQKRKKKIHSRRMAYAEGTTEKWKDKIYKKLDFYEMKKEIRKKYLHKLNNCQENFIRKQ